MELVNVLKTRNDEIFCIFLDKTEHVDPNSLEELESKLSLKQPYYNTLLGSHGKENIAALFIRLKDDEFDSIHLELVSKKSDEDDVIPGESNIPIEGALPKYVMYTLMSMLASTHVDAIVIENGVTKKEKIPESTKAIMDKTLEFMEGEGSFLVQNLYY